MLKVEETMSIADKDRCPFVKEVAISLLAEVRSHLSNRRKQLWLSCKETAPSSLKRGQKGPNS